MLDRLLGLDDAAGVGRLEWYLRQRWLVGAALLILAAIVLVAFLYRRERGVSKGRRILLGSLRAILYTILILMLFEPVLGIESTVKIRKSILVLVDCSESMATVDPRRERAELDEAARALGLQSFEKPSVVLPQETLEAASKASRLSLATRILDHPELEIFDRLRRDYTLRYFRFGDHLEPFGGDGEALGSSLAALRATDKETRLGDAIRDAVEHSRSGTVAGIILLTDGAGNGPVQPLSVVHRLRDKEQRIPIYPVGIGLPNRPDVRILKVIVDPVVFTGYRVPVRVAIASDGYNGRPVELVATVGDREVSKQTVILTGGSQMVTFAFSPEQKRGSLKLDVAIKALPGEATEANNAEVRTVRVTDKKIKVLYIEGKPRWEYRYLRAVLLRDERIDVQFIMTEGDLALADASDRHLARFPDPDDQAEQAFAFDLVILGDVEPSIKNFTEDQLAGIETLVRRHGGSLLMLAGHRYAPARYVGTPIEKMLPVRIAARDRPFETVHDSVHPVVPDEELDHPVVALERAKDKTRLLWQGVRPLYWLPALDGAKEGARVLASVSGREEPYPLIAWQRYGTGKSMFIATDQLWRLRYKVGDKYHANFWVQTIQFLTLSRLLGENRRIRLGTDRTECRVDDGVRIFARVLDEAYKPVSLDKRAIYNVYIENLDDQKGARAFTLEPVAAARDAARSRDPEHTSDYEGLYQGLFRPPGPGHYRIRAAAEDREAANIVDLHVRDIPREQLEGSMQDGLLKRLAVRSEGKYFTIPDLPSLPGAITGEQKTTLKRTEKELWDLPVLFAIILACAGTEWLLRRRYNLI